jgi:hypothetical protein
MALKIERQTTIGKPIKNPMRLAQSIETAQLKPKSWLKRLVKALFSSSDMDYSQWEKLESKRTSYQMKNQGLF